MAVTLDASQIRIAGTGSIWKAPLGTALPTDSLTAWNAAFTNLGFLQDGFIMTQEIKKQDVNGWQTVENIRSIVTALVRKFSFEALQTNKSTLSAAWGGAAITNNSVSIGTATIAITTGVVTVSVAHGLAVGNPVQFGPMTGAAPFVAGVTYYVQSVPSTTTLTLSATVGGALIATTTSGSSASISLVTGAYILTIPNGIAVSDFILGIDVVDGATSLRIIIQRATFNTLPQIKGSRLDSISYAFEVQALATLDGTNSVLVYGLDAAVGV